jgi:hypothetical protein
VLKQPKGPDHNVTKIVVCIILLLIYCDLSNPQYKALLRDSLDGYSFENF